MVKGDKFHSCLVFAGVFAMQIVSSILNYALLTMQFCFILV